MGDWWNQPGNVESYLGMLDGEADLIYLDDLLAEVAPGSRILELGMGPGTDLDLLARHYNVVGSDISAPFLERYRQRGGSEEVHLIDAVSMEFPTGLAAGFDAIVSNKSLVHIAAEELSRSLNNQASCLRPEGVLVHSFWAGAGEEVFNGLPFHYWNEAGLVSVLPEGLRIKSLKNYREFEEDDSLLVVFVGAE